MNVEGIAQATGGELPDLATELWRRGYGNEKTTIHLWVMVTGVYDRGCHRLVFGIAIEGIRQHWVALKSGQSEDEIHAALTVTDDIAFVVARFCGSPCRCLVATLSADAGPNAIGSGCAVVH